VVARAGAAFDKDLGDRVSVHGREVRCGLVAEMSTDWIGPCRCRLGFFIVGSIRAICRENKRGWGTEALLVRAGRRNRWWLFAGLFEVIGRRGRKSVSKNVRGFVFGAEVEWPFCSC